MNTKQKIERYLTLLPCTMYTADEIHELVFAPWVKQQQLEFLEVEEGRVKARMKQDQAQQFLGGATCGQAMMSAIDTVMSMAMLTFERNSRGTANQNNQFLRQAKDVDLIIEALVLKMGKHSGYGETRVYAEGSTDLLVHSTSEFAF